MARAKGMSPGDFAGAYVREVAGEMSLKERDNGDCVLLDGKNVCTVYDARPAQCRNYPFWPKHTASLDAWFHLMREECPGAGFRLLPSAPASWLRRLVAGVETVYRELEEELARLKPVCIRRGICCNFKAAGHALYVSAPEWLYFRLKRADDRGGETPPLRQEGPVDGRRGAVTAPPAGGGGETPPLRAEQDICPFLKDGLCGVREDRFLGCRSYFCDPAFAQDQPVVHEKYLARMRALADELGIPWQYEPLHQKVEREKLKREERGDPPGRPASGCE